jgi:N-acetylglucosamine-6-phosphate deacetylase
MILLSGADLVLPDRVLGGGTLVLDGDRIVEIVRAADGGARGRALLLPRSLHRPRLHRRARARRRRHRRARRRDGDRHDGGAAAAVRRHRVLSDVDRLRPAVAAAHARRRRAARTTRPPGGARVLPAHLESNFINPAVQGRATARLPAPAEGRGARREARAAGSEWTGEDILERSPRRGPDVGIVTLAPEIDGGIELIARSSRTGTTSRSAFRRHLRAGAGGHPRRRAAGDAHLQRHDAARAPRAGLAGAILESDDVTAELICDGVHVHPAMMRATIAAKRPERIMAITDGTAGSGLPRGTKTHIGGRRSPSATPPISTTARSPEAR